MRAQSHFGVQLVPLAAIGVVLLSVFEPMEPLLRGLAATGLVALMFVGIAFQWRESKDEVHKDAGRSAAITAIPIALVMTMLSFLGVRYSASASEFLTNLSQSTDGAAKVFALGAILTFGWILVAHFAALFVWWKRTR